MRKASPDVNYKKILVVRFSSLGDIVLTTPVLMALRRRYPNAQIDYLLKEQYRPLLLNHPSGCGIITLSEELRSDSKAYLEFCDNLRTKNYDLIVDLQRNGRSYVLRKRVFRDSVVINKRTLKRLLLIKFGLGKDRYPDVRRRFLKTIKRLGVDYLKEPPRAVLRVDKDEIDAAKDKYLTGWDTNDRLIAIHPGSRWEMKKWGDDKFVKLAKDLIIKGYNVLALGEPLDLISDNYVFAEETSLRELMALISLSDVFVGNDSGPLHIAEGLGTPAVGIFGPTHPSLGYAPRNDDSIVMGVELKCRPCTLYGSGKCNLDRQLCMERIDTGDVLEAVVRLTSIDERAAAKEKGAFLDRDGTIIYDAHFLKDPDKIEPIPGAEEAIKLLNQAGYKVVIVSNQSGVARGYFGIEVVERINDRVVDIFARKGARIDEVYFCPHHKEGVNEEYSYDCNCRKPAPGMPEAAACKLNLDLTRSIVIGDKASDIHLARNIGAKGYLVRTGNGADTEVNSPNLADGVFDDILEAVRFIISGD